MTKAELLQAQEQEQQLADQDRLMEQTKDRKNQLEAFVYEVRNKVIPQICISLYSFLIFMRWLLKLEPMAEAFWEVP